MNALRGKTAIVTGGSRGFGRGIVSALAAEGMRVIAVARGQAHLAALEREIEGKVETIAADVTDAAIATRTMQRERPQVLVLCAGAIVPITDVRHHTWESFSVNWDVDVKGMFLWVREALLLPLEPGSSIIVVSSRAARSTASAISGYIAAKAAQLAFSKSLATEAEALGIKVHCLLPQLTSETELGRDALAIFARRASVRPADIMERNGFLPPLTPDAMGEAVVRILTDPAYAQVVEFKLSGGGMESVVEADPATAQ